MSQPKTITVLVMRRRAGFIAHAGDAAGAHPNSSTLAARSAAARALGISEAAVELTPTGPDTLLAQVREPAPTEGWDLLVGALVSFGVIGLVGAVLWLLAQGGGR